MNINELTAYAATAADRVLAFLKNPGDDIASRVFEELAAAGGTLAVVADHLEGVATIQPELTAEELNLQTVLTAAALAGRGKITMDEFTGVITYAAFKAEGIDNPTEEQFANRLAEYKLIESFIGRANG